jgi:hypothetical protein
VAEIAGNLTSLFLLTAIHPRGHRNVRGKLDILEQRKRLMKPYWNFSGEIRPVGWQGSCIGIRVECEFDLAAIPLRMIL